MQVVDADHINKDNEDSKILILLHCLFLISPSIIEGMALEILCIEVAFVLTRVHTLKGIQK